MVLQGLETQIEYRSRWIHCTKVKSCRDVEWNGAMEFAVIMVIPRRRALSLSRDSQVAHMIIRTLARSRHHTGRKLLTLCLTETVALMNNVY